MADISNYILQTNRLILRPFQQTDLIDFHEYASVPGVGEAAGWKHHESLEETQKILDKFINEKKDFAIVLKENNKVIGSFGVMDTILDGYENYSQCVLGYVLSKDYWGKGLATEAAKRVIDFCFNELNLDLIWVTHGDFNDPSKRVIEKCEFTFLKDKPSTNKYVKSNISKVYLKFKN